MWRARHDAAKHPALRLPDPAALDEADHELGRLGLLRRIDDHGTAVDGHSDWPRRASCPSAPEEAILAQTSRQRTRLKWKLNNVSRMFGDVS